MNSLGKPGDRAISAEALQGRMAGAGPEETPGPALVMQIITRLNVGGPARQVVSLARQLPSNGYACDVVFGSEGRREGNVGTAGLHSVHLPHLRRGVNPAWDSRAASQLYRLISRRRPQIVHTHLAKAGALGRMSAIRARVPVLVHTFHGHVLSGYFPAAVTRTIIEFEKRMARHTDAFIAVSDRIRDELLSFGIGDPGKWRTIPLGLDLDDLMNSRYTKSEGRRVLGLPQAGLLVGMVGRLAPIKDPFTFLDACQLIGQARLDAQFVIAGDGPLRGPVEKAAHERLGARVKLLGWVSDLQALYAALDVVVLTSRNEGTPVALIEAAASATPVVATRVGGVCDVVNDGATGFLVAAGNPGAVAGSVLYLLDNKHQALSMGQAARAYVRDRFSADRFVRDVSALYDELLRTRGI